MNIVTFAAPTLGLVISLAALFVAKRAERGLTRRVVADWNRQVGVGALVVVVDKKAQREQKTAGPAFIQGRKALVELRDGAMVPLSCVKEVKVTRTEFEALPVLRTFYD